MCPLMLINLHLIERQKFKDKTPSILPPPLSLIAQICITVYQLLVMAFRSTVITILRLEWTLKTMGPCLLLESAVFESKGGENQGLMLNLL